VTDKLCSTVSEPENPFKMATGTTPSSMVSVGNFTDDSTKDVIDEETSGEDDWLGKTRKIMTINLKAALKASNDALANVKQKRVNDRRMYNTIITKITNHYKNKLQESRVSPLSWSQRCQPAQLAQQSRQSARQPCVDQAVQISHYNVADQAVQTESINEVSGVHRIYDKAAANEVTLKEEVSQLRKKMAELVFSNNRYHLSISNCTVCTSDDEFSDGSLSDVSIKASTPVTTSLGTLEPSISPVLFSSSSSSPASSSSVPALIPASVLKEKQANTLATRKDKTFINRMVKTLAKLEAKYQVPEHKRKKRLFSRKQRTNPIVPKELASIYHALAAPEPEAVAVLDPFPHVRWNDVKFKPALPNPEPCPVHSCSPDPAFYVEDSSPLYNGTRNFGSLARQYGGSFGTLPGYKTNLGVVAVPTTPVGGYVYCPDVKKWVLYAEPSSSPSAGRGTRRGGTPPARRRKG